VSNSSNIKKYLIVVVGPTAVGKTSFAVELAKVFKTAVINADSRQVYQEMKIGTAKPGMEEMQGVKHYFVNDRGLDSPLNAGLFEREALMTIGVEFKARDILIMSGGSGLYINAVCNGLDELPKVDPGVRELLNKQLENTDLVSLYDELVKKDPEYASAVDPRNPHRVLRALEIIRSTGKTYSSFRKSEIKQRSFTTIKIGLNMERHLLNDIIEKRMDQMIANGLFEEAKSLYKFKGLDPLQTVGYREIFDYMDGQYDYEEAVRLLKRNSRRYAKRQLTWFRRDPEIKWFDPNQLNDVITYVKSNLNA